MKTRFTGACRESAVAARLVADRELPPRAALRLAAVRVVGCGGILLAFCVSLLIGGCGGRAFLHSGAHLLEHGDARAAYLHFWRGYRANPTEEYRAAMVRAGRLVATAELEAARVRERTGEPLAALEHYAVGLEYAPDDPRLLLGLARLETLLAEWDKLLAQREAARRRLLGGGGGDELDRSEVDLARRLAEHPVRPRNWRSDLAATFARALDGPLSRLRTRTFETPLSSDDATLCELSRGWRRLHEELRQLRLESPEELRNQLDRALSEADFGLSTVAEARRGIELWQLARDAEDRGDPQTAFHLYHRATLHHRDLEVAKADRARLSRDLARAVEGRAALVSGDPGVPRQVVDDLESALESFMAKPARLVELLASAREDLVDRQSQEARREEERGLIGNALIRSYRAARAAREGELSSALAKLERRVCRHARRPLRVRLSSSIEESSSWSGTGRTESGAWESPPLAEAVLSSCRRALAGRRSGCPRGCAMTLGRDGWDELVVERVRFSVTAAPASSGRERSRSVEEIAWVEQPAFRELTRKLERLEAAYRQALELGGPAPRQRENVVELAALRLETVSRTREAFSSKIPRLSWRSASYPVQYVRSEAVLSVHYRLRGQTFVLRQRLSLHDRVVSTPAAHVVRDPVDTPSAEQVARELARSAGEALAAEAARRLDEAADRLFDGALRRLEQDSESSAVELLTAYIFARGELVSRRARAAMFLLESLSGADLSAVLDAHLSSVARF